MAVDPSVLTRLARLLRELEVDLAALDERADEAGALDKRARIDGALPRAELVLLAVNLHGYYTALETLLERVARLLDEEMPAGPGWHVELLEQMQTEVPGLRPSVIASETVTDLHELRKFRHFFRNAYVLRLDAELVLRHAERLARVHPTLRVTLQRLRAHVATLLQTAGAGI